MNLYQQMPYRDRYAQAACELMLFSPDTAFDILCNYTAYAVFRRTDRGCRRLSLRLHGCIVICRYQRQSAQALSATEAAPCTHLMVHTSDVSMQGDCDYYVCCDM